MSTHIGGHHHFWQRPLFQDAAITRFPFNGVAPKNPLAMTAHALFSVCARRRQFKSCHELRHEFYSQRMKSRRDFILAIAGALLARRVSGNDTALQEGITVNVEAHGELIVADVDFYVPANPGEIWAVLTDYEHMTDFLPNLYYSKKLEGTADTFQVAQRGKAFLGPIVISFAYIQEVTLTPYKEIRFHLISGTFKQLDGVVRLIEAGGNTHVVYHGASIPTFPLPKAIIVLMTEQTIREQFESMKKEILQRKRNPPR